ncbi:twin-arginine translocation pathway signal [Aldersonia sp. NBC_00410]|uniref:twin-arginine translocation pathway signal n=1 Tax=Aldersonia sp. NBC_00410 TaxID=2975954 RepID=UPI0022546C54|nr:twin-arginine translocation pathway signal [Aldersonia sp. NBC_00410]MCX5044313.1 twin-arginine translocation pathway signal [Aldersonia sp. NBC_00410]
MTPTNSDVLEADVSETDPAELPTAAPKLPLKYRVLMPVAKAIMWLKGHLGAAMLAVVLVASVATAATVYFVQYRPDQQTDAAATEEARAAAADGAVAVLTYGPDTLDQDLAAAQSHLTGDFLDYYKQFTEQVVAPAAKDKAVKTNAVVVRSAVSEMHPDSAKVLLFINQTTTSKDQPDPAIASSSVVATMDKVDGKWLISKFDPV